MTTKNWPRLVATYVRIRELKNQKSHQGACDFHWDQGQWGGRTSCGTAMCFAGWAATMHAPRRARQVWSRWKFDGQEEEGSFDGVSLDGIRYSVSEYAQKLLGLDYYEARELFDGDNTLGDIRNHLRSWASDDGLNFDALVREAA